MCSKNEKGLPFIYAFLGRHFRRRHPFLLRTLSYEYISSEDCHTMLRIFFFNQKQNDLFNSNQ